jgi:sortase (surface protein transpeptidase)
VRAPRLGSRLVRLLAVLLVVAGAAVLLTQLVGGPGGTSAPAAAGTAAPQEQVPEPGAPAPSSAAPSSSAPAAPTASGSPSAVPSSAEGRTADGAIVPTRIAIPAIDVDTSVETRGTVSYTNPFTGAEVSGYGVPESTATTSWWSDGPAPGSGRMAIVLGHSGHGVFDRLTALHAGDDVTMRGANGELLRLTVLGAPVTGLDKATSALADALNAHPADAAVALVTCGGEYDRSAAASEDNTVVFARLAG